MGSAKPVPTIKAASVKIPVGFMCTSSRRLPQRAERGSEFGTEEFRFLPRGEVAALFDFVEVDEIAIGAPSPCLRDLIDLFRKHRDGHGEGNFRGLLRGREQ